MDKEENIIQISPIIWDRKGLLLFLAMLGAIVAYAVAQFLPRIYRAETVLMPAIDVQSSSSAGFSGLEFGGLARLAGVAGRGTTGLTDHALAVLESRDFLFGFFDRHGVVRLICQRVDCERLPDGNLDSSDFSLRWIAYKYFTNNVLSIDKNPDSGLISLSIEWTDPVTAAKWSNSIVEDLNHRMREQAISDARNSIEYLRKELDNTDIVGLEQSLYRLLESQMETATFAAVQQDYAFRVIDQAFPPSSKDFVSPRPLLMGFLGAISFISLGIAVLLGWRWRQAVIRKSGS